MSIGVYIKGMDKPERCGVCPLRNGAKCVLHEVLYFDWYEEYAHCPLRPAPERERWIPVAERLPEKHMYVLVRYANNDMAVACWFDGDGDILFWRAMTDEGWCSDCDANPTHWMPLPKPPEEEYECP